MSAPPRSVVTLPRLTPGARVPASGPAAAPAGQRRQVRVGPGGGAALAGALCVAQVELPRAICAHLRLPFADWQLSADLALARAIVVVARRFASGECGPCSPRAARTALGRLESLSEAELIEELTSRIEAVAWPDWVPKVAFVVPGGEQVSVSLQRRSAPTPPRGVRCPLLAARLVSAIRGPVFLRDAAPSLTNLITFWDGPTPSRSWSIWLPVRPGQFEPLPDSPTATRGDLP